MTSIRATLREEQREAYRQRPYYGVGIAKFAVLALCTFGLYLVWWCYEQWIRERDREEEDLSPFWRTFFAIVWIFGLVGRIRATAHRHGVVATWSPTAVGVTVIVLNLAARLPPPYWLVSLLSFIAFIPVQETINRLNAQTTSTEAENRRLTGWSLGVAVVGGGLLALALLGTLFPPA